MAMLVGRWEAMREQRTVAEEREREYRALDAMTRAAEAAAAKEARRDVEMAAQRTQVERVQAEHAKERASRDAGERARRAVVRHGSGAAETRQRPTGTGRIDTLCDACVAAADNVCRSCAQHVTEMCSECVTAWHTNERCAACKRAARGMCKGTCADALETMCGTCRTCLPEARAEAEQRHAPRDTVDTEQDDATRSESPQPPQRRAGTGRNEGPERVTADAMRDAARWRRRATDTPGVTAIEFDTRSTAGWERRFYIRASDVAGRGLFTARRYAKGEYMTAYMGEDLGAIGSEEGLRGLERVENAKRADHVMEMRGRYVDGRHANAGAQYIN